MKRKLLPSFLTVFLLTTTVPALAAKLGTEKGVATVNGKTIPQSFSDELVSIQVEQGRPDSEQIRNSVKEELVRREIILQDAMRAGTAKKTEVKVQMEIARQGALINGYLQDYVRSHPISEENLKEEYEKIRTLVGDKEYKARHILVETEDAAKGIISRLRKGEKFDDLAKLSKDEDSKGHGGDLGWASAANFVRPFAEAMTKLEKGKYTESPVKSNVGYHVIELDDIRDLKAPSFDETKTQLKQRLQQRLVDKRIAELRSKAKIE